ncbi:MAG: carboxyl transferase domain-containing protein [Pseudomonadota bacterium]
MGHRLQHLLIANRGEIAVRIARSAEEYGLRTTAVYSAGDATSRHRYAADDAVPLPGESASAYSGAMTIVSLAQDQGCDAIHPGYGFLSEDPSLARQCREAGITFIGPEEDVLQTFGDKASSRELAERCKVPVASGTGLISDPEPARHLLEAMPAGTGIVIKAVAGGGGRGMRIVMDPERVEDAFAEAQREAVAAFRDDRVYAEQYLADARHIEIQVAGDATGNAITLGERDCSLQRNRQKVLEIAPAPHLPVDILDRLNEAACRMAREAGLSGIATFEFLVDRSTPHQFCFLECNPRIQVEHTITEEIAGVDLVRLQLQLSEGRRLAELDLPDATSARGFAVQARVNLETLASDGTALPANGRLTAYEPPGGPAVRVDDYGYPGFDVPAGFDALIAKVITRGPDLDSALARLYRALCEFRLEGVNSNLNLLANLTRHLRTLERPPSTTYLEAQLHSLLPTAQSHPARYHQAAPGDPENTTAITDEPAAPDAVTSPCAGRVASIEVADGDVVAAGDPVVVIEAMKMEFPARAPHGGTVTDLQVQPGDAVTDGGPLCRVLASGEETGTLDAGTDPLPDPETPRADLNDAQHHHQNLLDAARPEATDRRHRMGKQTARENLAQLFDDGHYREYGALALAAQRRRRPVEELKAKSPADGLIAGTGTVNAQAFDAESARCLAMAYDYTVFAGTQGVMNHKKTDRMLQLARQWRIPVVLFAEGGGGRPGDTDYLGVSGLDVTTFSSMAELSGTVPLVAVVSGRCFAGNAALAGCCDIIIATEDATLGMAGPAMIEGGGLGRFRPEEVGPVSIQAPNGVMDRVVADEAEAVSEARRYLGYFQGAVADWREPDQRRLRQRIPENRVRVYDIRALIQDFADEGSVFEIRERFAPSMITALIRIQGKPFGLIANNPAVLGGAIDAAAGDKAARFMQLCNAFGLPMVSLCDTPGFMVGPEAEREGSVRHVSRMFVASAHRRVPLFTLVLRKGYGLGAQAMAGGHLHSPVFTAAWPTGEFGAMGLEGAVRLGYAEELAAVEDPEEREALFRRMVDQAHEQGKALNTASFMEIDAVIDPADSRQWIIDGLNSVGSEWRQSSAPGYLDTW